MCGANAGAGNHATCGSYFNAKTESFPAVPYSVWDFNDGKCKSLSGDIEDYHDIPQVNLEPKSIFHVHPFPGCAFFVPLYCHTLFKNFLNF